MPNTKPPMKPSVFATRPAPVPPPVFRPQRPNTPAQMKAVPIRPAVIQRSAPVWNSSDGKHKFLNNEKEDMEKAFPPLGGGAPTQPLAGFTSLPTALDQWKKKPVTSNVPVVIADPLKALKDLILQWDRKSHAGRKWALSEQDVANMTAWAGTIMSIGGNSKAFNVVQGPGTGDFAAKDQLKIISIHGAVIGDKQPTYHITIKQ